MTRTVPSHRLELVQFARVSDNDAWAATHTTQPPSVYLNNHGLRILEIGVVMGASAMDKSHVVAGVLVLGSIVDAQVPHIVSYQVRVSVNITDFEVTRAFHLPVVVIYVAFRR